MKLTEIAIKRPAFITMVFCCCAVLGIYSYLQMGVDLLPKMNWPMVSVVTPYPGAGPLEVESQVSKPVEEALSSLSGMKSLRTYSNENVSFAWIEFSMSTDVNEALNDVERKINEIRLTLPQDVKQPQIGKTDLNAMPIMRIAAVAKMGDIDFYQFVKDRIRPKLEQIPGIASVTIVGGKEREIRIEVDSDKLNAYNISILQLTQLLAAENIDFPAGKIGQQDRRFIIRCAGKLPTLESIGSIIVAATPAGTIYLRDLVKVIDTYKEEFTLSRLNTVPSIGLIIQKSSDANAVKCSDRVSAVLKNLEREYAPKGLFFTVAQDITTFTRNSINDVRRDLLISIILVALVLFLFLNDIRNSLIVLLSIPTSIVTALIAMYVFHFTLNIITLMALTMVIGILVDDSIVVLENIHRHLEKGEEPRAAALLGRSEIGLAAIAITLVDVVVFVPIAMLTGVVGKIFKEFGITIVASTLVSLFVSFTLTPMLASRWSKVNRAGGTRIASFSDRFQQSLHHVYTAILTWSLEHKKTVVAVSFGLLLFSIMLIPIGLIGIEFIPSMDRGEFSLNIELPLGTAQQKTNEAATIIEDIVRKTPDVIQFYTIVGRREDAFSKSTASNICQIDVKLERKRKTQDVITEVLKKANRIPGVTAKASIIGIFGAAMDNPIAIEIKGEELPSLINAADSIKLCVLNTVGVRDVRSSWEEGQPELKIVINREKCAQYGITVAEVALSLRNSFEGQVSTKFKEQENEFDMRVILAESNRRSVEDIGQLPLVTRTGSMVQVRDIADIFTGKGPSEISRKDRSRVITISGNLTGKRALGDVTKEIGNKIKALNLPPDITVFFGGDAENMNDMLRDMLLAIGLAVLFVYMIMVSLFESYLSPFIIMFSVPVALVGGLTLLAITGENINLVSMIGMLLSIGLVAKNAILLVDYTNTLRSRGLTLKQALLEACPIRLRPILMTTATMVCGMMPLAVAFGSAAEMRRGLAVVVIGSLISSTMLSLVLVPVMYTILESWKRKKDPALLF